MKKFIPYLLFSATTIHTFLGTTPVIAMSCDTHSDKVEVVCKGDDKCQETISESTVN